MAASEWGHTDCVATLCESNADVEVQDKVHNCFSKFSAFKMCNRSYDNAVGRKNCAQPCCAAGARGLSASTLFVMLLSITFVQILLSHRANVNVQTKVSND